MRIKMYTTRHCGDCLVTKNFLDKLEIPYEEIDIESDPEAAAFVMEVNDGKRSVPTLVFGGEATSLSRFSRDRLDAFLRRHDLLTTAS